MNSGLSMCVAWACLISMTPVYSFAGIDHSYGNIHLLHYAFYISVAVMVAVVMFCMVRLLTADAADRGLQQSHHSQPWGE